MKALFVPCLLYGALIAGLPHLLIAQVPASQDTIYIPGGTLSGREHQGSLESIINADTTSTGARVNKNRAYALNEGQYYFQLAPINVNNPTGTLTIAGVPSVYGKTKPVIFIANSCKKHVVIHCSATNLVYGSLKFDNIYYVTQELDGYQNNELFYCGTANGIPQSLSINNCVFEFSNIDLFDCSDEPGAIGGWPYGAKFKLTNSYFRNMFHASQWWGSRVFQCTHPIDTLWVENCTVTTGGLTFLQRNQLTDFEYITHSTFVNNMKYWLTSAYHHYMFIVNNLFINQNWVGEDTIVRMSGQDPDNLYMGTVNIDTNNATNGLVTQGKYYSNDSSHFSAALDLSKLRVYVSDNVNYYDTLLINGYYNSSKYKLASINALPSYTSWGTGPYSIGNTPGIWMNPRTRNLFIAYGPMNGGFRETRTSTGNPGTATPGIADASVVDSMAVWNQNQWGDPRFPVPPALTRTKYIYGDYNPKTLPGIVNGVKSDTMTTGAAGITKFTDLTESFRQSVLISDIDGLPVGALIWDDTKLAAYNPANEFAEVMAKYISSSWWPPSQSVTAEPVSPTSFSLAQNYPNPFNPSTIIRYSLPHRSHVTLIVYNTLGQQVVVPVSGEQEAGNHEVQFDGSALASGVYFYRMQAESFAETKRFLLLR